MNAAGQFLKDKGIKKWDIIAVDYSSGHDAAEKFKALVKSQGGSIGKVLFAPFGTADFGAKISELGADPADGLYVTIFGSDADQSRQAAGAVRTVQEIQDGDRQFLRDPASAAGDGRYGARRLSDAWLRSRRAGRQAEAFVKAYKEKYNGELPPYTAADQYAAIQLMAAAINKANSTDVSGGAGRACRPEDRDTCSATSKSALPTIRPLARS